MNTVTKFVEHNPARAVEDEEVVEQRFCQRAGFSVVWLWESPRHPQDLVEASWGGGQPEQRGGGTARTEGWGYSQNRGVGDSQNGGPEQEG